jgi:hypothetical protein
MLLRSGEAHLKAEELAVEAARISSEEDRFPFPYDDCRRLRREDSGEFEVLIPDLDMWCSDIAGYCSWGKKILSWPEEKVLQARGHMSLSFFDKHPEYSLLERLITEANTPDLFEDLQLYERMRKKLLELFDFMLSEKH